MKWAERELLRQIGEFATAAMIVLLIWAPLRRPWRRRPLAREVALALFVAFMTGLLHLTLCGEWGSPAAMIASALERLRTGDKIHLRPFGTIGPQLCSFFTLTTSWSQLLGNVLLFMPWGFCLPLLWRRFRRPLRMVGMALALTCSIELVQLFIGRYVEVDDILLNASGALLGAGLWRGLHRAWPGMDDLFLGKNTRS
ncbi:MAG: VanZ family protein [Clostridia bacterium]|nr:VanZ family protein [Clostridia bacterium]